MFADDYQVPSNLVLCSSTMTVRVARRRLAAVVWQRLTAVAQRRLERGGGLRLEKLFCCEAFFRREEGVSLSSVERFFYCCLSLCPEGVIGDRLDPHACDSLRGGEVNQRVPSDLTIYMP